jgi:arylsulfatase
LERSTVAAPAALTPGIHTVFYEFVYDGGKPGSGGTSRLNIDGQPAGEVRVPRTMPFAYSADEGVDVGVDKETPVTEGYEQGANEFTGRIVKVTVEAK